MVTQAQTHQMIRGQGPVDVYKHIISPSFRNCTLFTLSSLRSLSDLEMRSDIFSSEVPNCLDVLYVVRIISLSSESLPLLRVTVC